MYEYRPVRTNANAKIAALFCLLVCVISFVVSSQIPNYPWILQSFGICFLVPLIQITARYLILQYLYRVKSNEDGSVDFEIFTYRGGTRMQLVCRIGLSEITAAAPLSKANQKPPAKLRRYNYHPDLKPREGFVLSITNGDGDCEILLAPDAHLREIFEKAASEHTAAQL